MTEETRKGLEEAVKKQFACKHKVCSASCPLYHPEAKLCLQHWAIKYSLAGVELGYKEAIAQAKEWLDYKVGGYLGLIREEGIIGSTFRTAQMLTDFEADMNKLWEEKK